MAQVNNKCVVIGDEEITFIKTPEEIDEEKRVNTYRKNKGQPFLTDQELQEKQ